MRFPSVRVALAAAALALAAACGDGGTTPHGSGPVDLTIKPIVFNSTLDTATAIVTLDDTLTFTMSEDTLLEGVSRGRHTLKVESTVDYLAFTFRINVDPPGSRATLGLPRPGTCRETSFDGEFCVNNAVYWRRHTFVFCPTNDYGDFCTAFVDPFRLGLLWPDSGQSRNNGYSYTGKLLIGAKSNGVTLATAFYNYGDYAPRTRFHAASGDSSRFQAEAWTDARHLPFFPEDTARLADTVRVGQNFGLSVRSTYFLPPSAGDAMLIRFDIKNISNDPDYRFRHPEEPAGGHTLTDVFLTPMLDADVGSFLLGGTNGRTEGEPRTEAEATDDNATMFPAESLLVVYDQDMLVAQPRFSAYFSRRPGLVGFQLISGPPGTTAKGVILNSSATLPLDFARVTQEDTTYRLIAGGRNGGLPAVCTTNDTRILLCAAETPNNARVGWSVGPIASLAPGQEVSITVGVLLATPSTAGGLPFSGTVNVAPQNNQLDNTTRQIYTLGAGLRALAAQTKTITVNGAVIPTLHRAPARRVAPR